MRLKSELVVSSIALLVASMLFLGCHDSDNDPEPETEPESQSVSLLLNEFKSNIPDDMHALQYIELKGPEDQIIKDTCLVVIDGDGGDEGHVDYALDLDGVKVGSNGLIMIKNKDEYNDLVSPETTVINEELIRTYDPDVDGEAFEDGLLEHDAVTYALVRSETVISMGDDLDIDDDGKLELPEGAEIIDSVGSLDGGKGFVYGNVILSQSASDPDGATRFRDNFSANFLPGWANGDIYEDPSKNDKERAAELIYDTLEASSNLPPKAALTPGSQNFKQAPFVLLNEIVTTGDKYIEVLSNANQTLADLYLVGIYDQSGRAATCIDLSPCTAKDSGLTLIKEMGVSIEEGSGVTATSGDLSLLSDRDASVILIYSPEHDIQPGDDLDFNDDGLLDLPDGAIIVDNFGWGNSPYSDVRVNVPYAIQGASRYKDNRICAVGSWTYGEVSGLNYVGALSKNVPEAGRITPAQVNVAEETALLVSPSMETVRSTITNPDADDMAFWIHPDDPAKSLIIATQKEAGYSVYNVNGETLLDALPDGNRFNNIDVMYDFPLNGGSVDIAVFTDRVTNRFALYRIQETAPYIIDVTDPSNSAELFEAEKEGDDTAYGEGVYKSSVSGRFYLFATQNGTWNVAQFQLIANGDKIGWKKIRTITLGADDDDKHAEGIVVDQEYGKAYIAQEAVGIYTLDAEPGDDPLDIVLDATDLLVEEGDNNLREDLEGMTLYYKDDGEGYLFISSQGNNTYGVFNRTNVGVENRFIQSFAVVDNLNGIDGAQHTDSLDVTNIGISPLFPNGVFIVQDGTDTKATPDDAGTNFKWIEWEKIAAGLGDTTFTSNYDPRTPTPRR